MVLQGQELEEEVVEEPTVLVVLVHQGVREVLGPPGHPLAPHRLAAQVVPEEQVFLADQMVPLVRRFH